jgi:hypothetical protein
MNTYTHQAVILLDGPPRAECGGSGRSVFRMADVDCPDCLRLGADRRARTAEPEQDDVSPLMTVKEVAKAFRVADKMPNEWAKAGLITRVKTPSGMPRYVRAQIKALLAQGPKTPPFLKRGAA